jgi:prepilin signal peptidase PulO-like enzyme (type II secretory pathway)
MLHEPTTPTGKDPARPYKTRLGIWMFVFYSLFYASFVAINLLKPLAMAIIVFAGLNLATVYGFLCRRKESSFYQAENNETLNDRITKNTTGKG